MVFFVFDTFLWQDSNLGQCLLRFALASVLARALMEAFQAKFIELDWVVFAFAVRKERIESVCSASAFRRTSAGSSRLLG
jgi:hypothetical protein